MAFEKNGSQTDPHLFADIIAMRFATIYLICARIGKKSPNVTKQSIFFWGGVGSRSVDGGNVFILDDIAEFCVIFINKTFYYFLGKKPIMEL